MRLRQLEILLERVQGFSRPDPSLEHYMTPAPLAARLLYDAHVRGDIGRCHVCDLGCGTGVLGIGAALLGAESVTAVDSDGDAISIAEGNAREAGVRITFLHTGIGNPSLPGIIGKVDTVVMNPPFGAQTPHADRPFIDLALDIADVVYGIFNEGSVSFVRSYANDRARVEALAAGVLRIPRTFRFHTRECRDIPVEILLLRRRGK